MMMMMMMMMMMSWEDVVVVVQIIEIFNRVLPLSLLFCRSFPILHRLLFPSVHSCLPCDNLQDAACPVPNVRFKIGQHPASCCITKIVG